MNRKMLKNRLVALGLCSALFLSACGEPKIEVKAPEEKSVQVFITPTPMGEKNTATSLKVCDDEKIKMLFSTFYTALGGKDYSALKPLVTDVEKLNSSIFTPYQDAKSVDVKKIYMLEGEAPINFIVYVHSEIVLEGIETPVPSLEEYFVTVNENGEYRVLNGSVSRAAYNAANEKIKSESGVSELKNSINKEFEEALEKDAALKSYADEHKKVKADSASQ